MRFYRKYVVFRSKRKVNFQRTYIGTIKVWMLLFAVLFVWSVANNNKQSIFCHIIFIARWLIILPPNSNFTWYTNGKQTLDINFIYFGNEDGWGKKEFSVSSSTEWHVAWLDLQTGIRVGAGFRPILYIHSILYSIYFLYLSSKGLTAHAHLYAHNNFELKNI